MFCLRILTSPPPSGFFQSTSPFVLSTAQRKRLPLSATFKKIWLRQTIGVEPLHPSIATFQATFSSVVHFTGRFFSLLTPLSAGPRHCGQFSAEALFSKKPIARKIPTRRLKMVCFMFGFLFTTRVIRISVPAVVENAGPRLSRRVMLWRPKLELPGAADPARCLDLCRHAQTARERWRAVRKQIPPPGRGTASGRFL